MWARRLRRLSQPCQPLCAGADLKPEDVIAHSDGKLARFKMPRQVEFVDELPRNPQGKILKRVLRDQFGE